MKAGRANSFTRQLRCDSHCIALAMQRKSRLVNTQNPYAILRRFKVYKVPAIFIDDCFDNLTVDLLLVILQQHNKNLRKIYMSEIIESFKRDFAETNWRELRIHLRRDVIIVVSSSLDLIETAMAVAADDKIPVENWIASGQLEKPTKNQLESWEAEQDKPFKMLIVQPFILIQEVAHV